MAMIAGTHTHSEFTSVAKLAGVYFAIHTIGTKYSIISNFEKDIKTAQIRAKTFANAHNVDFDPSVSMHRIITVVHQKEGWFPADVDSEKVTLIKRVVDFEVDGDLQQILMISEIIASFLKIEFHPELSLSFNR